MIQELRLREPGITDSFKATADFVRSFFGWWYGDIPIYLFSILGRTLAIINDRTSFLLILKGFFKPWKNDFNPLGLLFGIAIKSLYVPLILLVMALITSLFIVVVVLQLVLLPVIIGLILVNPFLTP